MFPAWLEALLLVLLIAALTLAIVGIVALAVTVLGEGWTCGIAFTAGIYALTYAGVKADRKREGR